MSRNGPATAPADPARFQRAMCCSCRAGSASIRPDWVRPTNAPEAGKKATKATSSAANEPAGRAGQRRDEHHAAGQDRYPLPPAMPGQYPQGEFQQAPEQQRN